jgi:hypothetical protein
VFHADPLAVTQQPNHLIDLVTDGLQLVLQVLVHVEDAEQVVEGRLLLLVELADLIDHLAQPALALLVDLRD